jgi:Uma2 family endonuclease
MAVRQGGLPLKVCDSSTGFQLPDGSIRSPDASLGWLLLPESRSVEVWSAVDPADDPGRQASPEELLPQRITAARRLDASPLFPGLALDLEEIWVA